MYNGQAGDVESVMVDSRSLMRGRRVLTIDESDVVTRADRHPDVLFPIKLPPPVSGRGGQ